MRLRTIMVALAACALLASACSSDGDPTVLPTLTSTPSTAAANPVVVPSAATVHNSFGAAAFVRFYYDQLNMAYSTADPARLMSLSDPSCGTCKSYMQAAQKFSHDSQHVVGTSARVLSAEAPPEVNGVVAVDVFFDAPARRIVDAQGQVVQQLAAVRRFHKTVFVVRVEDRWLLRAVKDPR